MREVDKFVFVVAAKNFGAWILVRRTNPASLPYIGRAGYVPKRIDCKAKTARYDAGRYQLKGLVVSPIMHEGAFDEAKLEKAKGYWAEMVPKLGTTYRVDEDRRSVHCGCLQFGGNYIHADYDLYDFVDMSQAHRNLALVESLHGQAHFRGPKLDALRSFVNGRIGTPMLQHGGSAQFEDHSEQAIDAFGPNGECVTLLNEFTLRHWYKERFGGRRTLVHG